MTCGGIARVCQVEIKVYKQKVKHLLYEHQNNVSQLKEEQERALKLQLEEHRLRESESKKDKRSLKLELKEVTGLASPCRCDL